MKLVPHLRAIGRIMGLCGVTGFFYAMWTAVTPFLLAWPRIAYRWRNLNFRNWARVTAALLRMRVAVQGTPPQAPFFLVSNHLSYLDIVAFASQMDSVFIAKSEVALWPILGYLCQCMGTIFIKRNSRKDVLRVNSLIERALRSGKGLLLFPEATSGAGAEVLPFHTALLEPPVKEGYPVSYATLTYQTPTGQPPAYLSVCWWGEMPFLSHFYELLQLKSLDATLVFGADSIRADDRKELGDKLWQAVNKDFTPVLDLEALGRTSD